MQIIKVKNTRSTNTFLKEMLALGTVKNMTVVIAEEQSAGRGQMHTRWISEKGKNLTFSVFCSFEELSVSHQKYLNFAVSLAIQESIHNVGIYNCSIKWPNDILISKKKVAGILIENTLSGEYIKSAIVGIGINVNQLNISDKLPFAVSLIELLQRPFDLDELLEIVLDRIAKYISLLKAEKYHLLEQLYFDKLYKYQEPTMFQNQSNEIFMGKIIGVSNSGKLQLELVDETTQEFGIKKISFLN